jgi:uncharacterized damage-inducible protein DinB
MDTDDFRVLFEYNAWANRRTLESCAALAPGQFLQDMKSSFSSIRDTLAHIYAAQFIWLERWNRRTPSALPTPADFPDQQAIGGRLAEMDRSLIAFVSNLDGDTLLKTIDFRLLNGTPMSSVLAPMLQHVANHSTYHRGQIATMLRQLGTKALSTDLIAYHRELAAKASA